jgi:hypothetical protein
MRYPQDDAIRLNGLIEQAPEREVKQAEARRMGGEGHHQLPGQIMMTTGTRLQEPAFRNLAEESAQDDVTASAQRAPYSCWKYPRQSHHHCV